MTLQEAIKSGRRFRRRGDRCWYEDAGRRVISSEEVLAEDWEVEEDTIEISKSQLEEAYIEARKQNYLTMRQTVNHMAKKLGL